MNITQFRAYILRKLGAPFHRVELTNEQLDDSIYEAVDRFTERHYDSVLLSVYKLQLENGKNTYILPNNIKTVINVLPGNNIFSAMTESENMLIPVTPMPYQDYLWKLSDVSAIMTYRMAVKQWEDSVSNQNLIFDFNYTMHRVTILGDINKIRENFPNSDSFYLMVYETPVNTAEEGELIDEDIFNNRWLKQYATALAKKQWATNLKKYTGVPLPGGGDINYDGIMNDANEEIQRLEEELSDEWTLPPTFLIG